MATTALQLDGAALPALLSLLAGTEATHIGTGLWVGPPLVQLAIPAHWAQAQSSHELLNTPFSCRYPVAIVHLPAFTAADIPCITRLRDLMASKVLVLLGSDAQHTSGNDATMRSLAFSKIDQLAIADNQQHYQLWQFNIYNYKQLPDWLNAKFWANPDNWGKYRW